MLRFLNRYSHSIWSGVLLTIRTLSGFGIQKLVAIFYGPAGTTLFSHFQNFVVLFSQPIQDAIASAVISAFPKKDLKKPQIVGAAIILILSLLLITGSILLFLSRFDESILSFSLAHWFLIIPSLILFCFGLMFSAIYVIQQKLRLYSFIILSQWIVFFVLVSYWDLELKEVLIFWLLIQSLFSAILIIPVRLYLKFNFQIAEEVRSHFKQFLIMALTVWISSKWVDFYIREYAVDQFGVMETGLWQSIVRISQAYRGLMISFLFLSFYPIISRKIAENSLKLISLLKQYSVYFFYCCIFLVLVYQFDEEIIRFLYDAQYQSASSLFRYQIMGDVLAFAAFPFSIYLMAAVKTKTYIAAELLSAAVFVGFILVKSAIGIEVLVFAHIFRFMVYAFFVSSFGLKYLQDAR
jgi:PST family polysaccharide transporter